MKTALAILALLALGLLAYLSTDSEDIKRKVEIETASMAGKVASKIMDRAASERANQLHNVPISVERINDYIYQARGIGNTHVIATSQGHVLFDTGISVQAADQFKQLREAIPEGDITHIIVSHSHADHIGGVKFWKRPDTEIIAHVDFAEEQRYLTDLEDYFWNRNRLLFPFMPKEPPKKGMFAYGGVEPTITVADWQVHRFEQGGVIFEVYGTPAAEGADNVVLWLPEEKILFSGDAFGPLFPQFPNTFTMRGEKVRKPIEYIHSLNLMIDLKPEMIVPGHFSPVVGVENTVGGMVRMRDAVQHVHDAVVAGMNGGKTMYQLMDEVRLPPELELSQGHGKVSWAVKSIWEYYATWFHFESTTELYHVPVADIYTDIAALAGAEALVGRAAEYRNSGRCLRSLHLLEVALSGSPGLTTALEERAACLDIMLDEARALNNTYEVMWLESRIEKTREMLVD